MPSNTNLKENCLKTIKSPQLQQKHLLSCRLSKYFSVAVNECQIFVEIKWPTVLLLFVKKLFSVRLSVLQLTNIYHESRREHKHNLLRQKTSGHNIKEWQIKTMRSLLASFWLKRSVNKYSLCFSVAALGLSCCCTSCLLPHVQRNVCVIYRKRRFRRSRSTIE